jgi:flagellin-like hook-associated protein FlgL
LGLIADGSTSSTGSTEYAAVLKSTDISGTEIANTAILVSSTDSSTNAATIVLSSTASGVAYDSGTNTLTVGVVAGQTTANQVVDMINNSAYSSMFHAELDPIGGNTGEGYVQDGATTNMASSGVINGTDVNEKETESVFTALIRLKNALASKDTTAVQHAVDVLDNATSNLDYSYAQLGSHEQTLDSLKSRLTTETTNLKALLSDNFDADLTEVASNLVQQEAAVTASLKATASILKMSLLDYL